MKEKYNRLILSHPVIEKYEPISCCLLLRVLCDKGVVAFILRSLVCCVDVVTKDVKKRKWRSIETT